MGTNGTGSRNSTLRILALTSGMGCSVAVVLIAFIGGGIFLDGRFDSSPIWTLVGVGVGITAVGMELAAIVRISRTRAASVPWPKSSRPPDPDDDDDWGR